jgi:hypothetical protein
LPFHELKINKMWIIEMWKYLPLVTQIGAALSCGYIISYILKWLVGPKKIPNPAVEQSDKKTD